MMEQVVHTLALLQCWVLCHKTDKMTKHSFFLALFLASQYLQGKGCYKGPLSRWNGEDTLIYLHVFKQLYSRKSAWLRTCHANSLHCKVKHLICWVSSKNRKKHSYDCLFPSLAAHAVLRQWKLKLGARKECGACSRGPACSLSGKLERWVWSPGFRDFKSPAQQN